MAASSKKASASGSAAEDSRPPKTKQAERVCFIVGSDESEVKRAAAAVAEKLVPASAGEFARDIIDGVAENVDAAATRIHAAIDALRTLPFLGGEKLVWLKNANFLGDTPAGRSETVQAALEKLLETLQAGLPDDVKFLLSATEIDKRRSFYKTLPKLGAVEVFDRVDTGKSGWEEAASGAIEARARGRGLRFTADALELFTLFTGGESRAVENEIEKLDLFLGPERRDIRLDDVHALTPQSRAGVIFELGNALARRDLARCLAILDELLANGEKPIGILIGGIVSTVRNLLMVKELLERHRLQPPQAPQFFGSTLNRLPPEATAHLPKKKDGTVNSYGLGIAATNARRFTLDELRRLFEGCLRANVQLVTTQLDARVILTELLALAGKEKRGR